MATELEKGKGTKKDSKNRPEFKAGEKISVQFEEFILSFDNELRQLFLYYIKRALDSINRSSNNELKLAQQLRDTQNKRYMQINSILDVEVKELAKLESILSDKNFSDPNINDVFKILRSPQKEFQSRKDSNTYEIQHNRYFLYRASGNIISFFDRDLLRNWDNVFRAYTDDPDYFIEQSEILEEPTEGRVLALSNSSKVNLDNISVPKDFEGTVQLIIDNFEGGYVDPLKHAVIYSNFAAADSYKRSGETMYGIDRANYGKPETSEANKAFIDFWNLIDEDKEAQKINFPGTFTVEKSFYFAETDGVTYEFREHKRPAVKTGDKIDIIYRDKWKWNYKVEDRPDFATNLKKQVAIFMKARFQSFLNRYDKDKKIEEFINADKRIELHFAYAVWNGPGWFQSWVNAANTKIKEERLVSTNPEHRSILAKHLVIDKRQNNNNDLIARGGVKMARIIQSNAFTTA